MSGCLNSNHEIDVLCFVQWRLLSFSQRTKRLSTWQLRVPFGGINTPRMCLSRSAGAVLCKTKIWDVGRELIGCGMGKWLVLLRCEDDCGDSVSDE